MKVPHSSAPAVYDALFLNQSTVKIRYIILLLPACQYSLDASTPEILTWVRIHQFQWESGPTVNVPDPDPVGLASFVPDPDPYPNKKIHFNSTRRKAKLYFPENFRVSRYFQKLLKNYDTYDSDDKDKTS